MKIEDMKEKKVEGRKWHVPNKKEGRIWTTTTRKQPKKKQQLKNKYSPTECCKARLALALALHTSEFIVFFFVTQKKSNKIQIGNIGKKM